MPALLRRLSTVTFTTWTGLGLALIEEHGETLLALMHHVREQASGGHSLIRTSVETLFDYIFANQGMSRMILLESMSRHSVFREAAERVVRNDVEGPG